MSHATRLLVGAAIRLLLLAAGVYIALAPGALGDEVSAWTRGALAFCFLILTIVVGEVQHQRLKFEALLGAVHKVAAGARAEGAKGGHDPRAAVDLLVGALRGGSAASQSTAFLHLRRLTGQDLSAEPEVWERWWKQARATYQGPPAAGGGTA